MNNFSVLQWNMGDSPYVKKKTVKSRLDNPEDVNRRAKILYELIDTYKPTFVMLQESASSLVALVNHPDYELQRGDLGLNIFVKLNLYKIVENNLNIRRVQMLALDSLELSQKGIKLINIHLPILYKNEVQRREEVRMLMPLINFWRSKFDSRFEIVAGDFNLPPYDEIIITRSGFFSNRDLSHARNNKIEKGFGNALFNVSWSIFSGTCGSLGTYYLADSYPNGPWHIPDQILIGPELEEDSIIKVKVITSVNSLSLINDKTFSPNKRVASDHLPVLLNIEKS